MTGNREDPWCWEKGDKRASPLGRLWGIIGGQNPSVPKSNRCPMWWAFGCSLLLWGSFHCWTGIHVNAWYQMTYVWVSKLEYKSITYWYLVGSSKWENESLHTRVVSRVDTVLNRVDTMVILLHRCEKVLAWYVDMNGIEIKYSYPTRTKKCEVIVIDTPMIHVKKRCYQSNIRSIL